MANPEFFFVHRHCRRDLRTQCPYVVLDGTIIANVLAIKQNTDNDRPLLIDFVSVERSVHFVERKTINGDILRDAVLSFQEFLLQECVKLRKVLERFRDVDLYAFRIHQRARLSHHEIKSHDLYVEPKSFLVY